MLKKAKYIQKIRVSVGFSSLASPSNMINGKRNIGSSVDLRRRLREYFSISSLNKNQNLVICRALLKYDYSNFSVKCVAPGATEILEYCDPSEMLTREKYFFDLLLPEHLKRTWLTLRLQTH
jgi:group I intron endonuclease